MAKLTDFDSKELQTLLDIVVAKLVEEDIHKHEWVRTFANDITKDLDFYWDLYDRDCRPLRPVNYEHLCLWRTQILDAIGKVGVQEMINNS